MPAAPPLQAHCETGAWRNRISFCHRASPGHGFVVVWTAVLERQRHKYTVSPGQAGCCRARNLIRCNRSWKFRRFLSFPNQTATPAAVNQLWLSERISSVLQKPVGPGLHRISNYHGSVSSVVWERSSDPERFLLIFLLQTAVPCGSAGRHHPSCSHGDFTGSRAPSRAWQAGTKPETPHGSINAHPEGEDTSKGSSLGSSSRVGAPPTPQGAPCPPGELWQPPAPAPALSPRAQGRARGRKIEVCGSCSASVPSSQYHGPPQYVFHLYGALPPARAQRLGAQHPAGALQHPDPSTANDCPSPRVPGAF